MICLENVKEYCRDDISKIENYQEAVSSPEQWDCHHRLECTLDGEFAHTYKDLKRMGMYYSRPYFELIFLTRSEHMRMHSKGKTISEEHKQRISEANKGKKLSEETKQKMRENHGGGVTQHSEETKNQISESLKGRTSPMKGKTAWNKGKKCSPHSEETKQKTRESMKLYWAKKRTLKNTGVNPDFSLF